MPRQNCNGICATVGWPVESFGVSIRLGRTSSIRLACAGPLQSWFLGLLWILPLVYAVWTAFHPAWAAAPFARYFLNTFLLITLILCSQLVICTLAGYAFARFQFRENPAVSGGLVAGNDHARNPHGRKLSDHEQSWPGRYGARHRASVHGLRFRHLPASTNVHDRSQGAMSFCVSCWRRFRCRIT